MSGTLIPFGLKMPASPATAAYASLLSGLQPHTIASHAGPVPPPAPLSGASHLPSSVDLQRAHAAQLYDLTARLRFGLAPAAYAPPQPGLSPAAFRPSPFDPVNYFYGQHDPRARFFHEEPKPSHSYIGLIAMAILSSKEKKLILSDIYQWILDNYNYFRTRGPGWRNSIRHNLSLNDCFIKSGRAANGKGHYWAIHPAVEGDFEKGDFRRRRAQRKVRKAMGLAVPDEEDSPSPPPPSAETLEWRKRMLAAAAAHNDGGESASGKSVYDSPEGQRREEQASPGSVEAHHQAPTPAKKRGFDVASLLAPDAEDDVPNKRARTGESESDGSEDVEVCADDGEGTGEHTDHRTEHSGVDKSEGSSVTGLNPFLSAHGAAASPAVVSSVLSAWPGRPSAFHSLPGAHPAWRPLIPTSYAMGQHLLRQARPGMPFPAGIPMQAPRIIIPATATMTGAEGGAPEQPSDLSCKTNGPSSPNSEANIPSSPISPPKTMFESPSPNRDPSS